MQEITLSEALAQGYTHFRMGTLTDDAEQFYVIPLTEENLATYTRRGVDEAYDSECASKQDGDLVEVEHYFGTYPILCEKAKHPSVSSSDLVEWLVEHNELNDELVPASLQEMYGALAEDEDFKAGLELINKAMAEFKSYADAQIKVVS